MPKVYYMYPSRMAVETSRIGRNAAESLDPREARPLLNSGSYSRLCKAVIFVHSTTTACVHS